MNTDKQLLLKDLCARLPYMVKICFKYDILMGETTEALTPSLIEKFNNLSGKLYQLKPYLRPMSSMTEEEKKIYNSFIYHFEGNNLLNYEGYFVYVDELHELMDWLNAHHFDYRGLIEKGLALTAPDGMYNFK